jgi:ABC-type lipoprotein release transport system permease subunit
MNKIFNKFLFERKSYLYLFSFVLAAFSLYTAIQGIFLSNQVESSIQPQIELYGSLDDDGIMRYKLLNSVGNLASVLTEKLDKGIGVSGAVVRNMLTVNNFAMRVDYWVWGLPDNRIKDLSRYLSRGRIPDEGKSEVLIGGYAAKHFEVGVNDVLDMTLKAENLEGNTSEYVVSGILNDSVDYYKGALIISKDHWINKNGHVDDNFILLYLQNDGEYKKAAEAIENLDGKEMEGVSVNSRYQQSNWWQGGIIGRHVATLSIDAIVIFMIISYTMKGISKKIGLLKALGLPDKYIAKSLYSGFLLISAPIVALSILAGFGFAFFLNRQASNFYGFPVVLYKFDLFTLANVIGLNILIIIAVMLTATYLSKKISPRDAMLKI